MWFPGGGGVIGFKFCYEGERVIQNLDDGSKFGGHWI